MKEKEEIKAGDRVTSIHGGDIYRVRRALYDENRNLVAYEATPTKTRILQAECVRKLSRPKLKAVGAV